MAIVVCGLSHKTVPLPVLEQVAFTPDGIGKALAQLMDQDPIHEGVILSTCNRTEVYATVHRFHPAVEAVKHFISDASGVAQSLIADGMYTYYDTDAVRHLFNVASGCDSMVVGEAQILGQVREAFRAAREEGTARRMLGALFQRALRVGKRARTETAIARHVVSLPQAAARTAAEVAGGLAGKRVVVIGAGRMGELAARAAVENGSTDVVIANRTRDKAEKLATKLDGTAVGLDDLAGVLPTTDVLIGVTSSNETIVDADMLRGPRRIVVIDIAVPRDIDPKAREIDGVELYDLDDLRSIVERGAERRQAELPKVAEIVEGEVSDFCAWERSLALGPAISELRDWAERIRADEVKKIARKGDLDDAELERIERMTKSLVNKLLHRPMTQMRELVRDSDGQVYLEAFQEIFDLDAE